MNSVEKKLGKNLKYLRNLLDITQVKFAKSINITNSYISAIEKGIAINISDQIFNSIELIYGIKRKVLEEGRFTDIDVAIKDWLNYSENSQESLSVAQPKSNYDKHGGWTPQTDETDWGCIGKVARIIKSDTIYSKALLQNIDAFYEAVMAGEDQRKGERREQDIDYDGEDRRKGERRKKTASGE